MKKRNSFQIDDLEDIHIVNLFSIMKNINFKKNFKVLEKNKYFLKYNLRRKKISKIIFSIQLIQMVKKEF